MAYGRMNALEMPGKPRVTGTKITLYCANIICQLSLRALRIHIKCKLVQWNVFVLFFTCGIWGFHCFIWSTCCLMLWWLKREQGWTTTFRWILQPIEKYVSSGGCNLWLVGWWLSPLLTKLWESTARLLLQYQWYLRLFLSWACQPIFAMKRKNKHGNAKHGDQPTERAGLSAVVHEFLKIMKFMVYYTYIIDISIRFSLSHRANTVSIQGLIVLNASFKG